MIMLMMVIGDVFIRRQYQLELYSLSSQFVVVDYLYY